MGSRIVVATKEIEELLAYVSSVGGQEKLAGRLGIRRPQVSRWGKAVNEETEIRVRPSTFEAIERVLAELRVTEADMQFRQGVRFAIAKLVPALEGLRPYAPDLIPISPTAGDKVGVVVGTVHGKVEREAAKPRAVEKKKRDA